MAQLLTHNGAPDQFVAPEAISGLSPDEALAVVIEQYEESEWLVDLLEVEPDGALVLALASPHDGLVYETRLTA